MKSKILSEEKSAAIQDPLALQVEPGRKPGSKILGDIHESVAALHASGIVDKQTMRQFDELCLVPVDELTADDIRSVRTESGVSQAVFASYLHVSVGLISQWERGVKKPSGAALKLLTLVKRHGLDYIA